MADNKRVTKEILELEVQVKDRESRKKIRELTHTIEELTEQQIKGGQETAQLTKEILASLKLQEVAFGKNSRRLKNHQKLAFEAMRQQEAGNKDALKNRVKNIQASEREMKSIYKALHAADALGKALAEQSRIKSQSIEDDKEREKFLQKEAEINERIVATRKEEAMKLKKKSQVLKEITKETAAVRENTEAIAKESRGKRYLNNTMRGASALGSKTLGAVDSLSRGYSRQGLMSVVGDIKGMGASASSRLKGMAEESKTKAIASAGKGVGGQALLQSATKLSSIFSKLATVVGIATRFLGAFASVIMVAIEADAKQKEMNRKLSSKMGSAGMKSSNMAELTSSIVSMALRDNPTVGGLRLDTEELSEGSSTLLQSGVNIKNLTGGFQSFESILETTAVASRNFGMEMSEAAGMVGDYFNSFGAGAETIKDTFASLNKDIKSSSMSTNQFLATINSVSAQFNLFIDQTKEFSLLLNKMTKGGAFSAKQINKYMQTLAGFGPQTVDEGLRTMALFGPQIQETAKRDMGDLEKKIMAGDYGSEAERAQDLRRLENLRVISRGGINAGTAVKDGMGSMGVVEAVLKKQGIQNFNQMRDAKNNLEIIKILSASTGKSNEEIQDMLEAASTLMENGNQTFSELMQKNREELMKATDAKTARREAEEYASQTVTKMSGLQDIGNALLLKIAQVLTKIYNIFAKVTPGVDALEDVSIQKSKDALTSEVGSYKEWAMKQRVTNGWDGDAAFNVNMGKRLFGGAKVTPAKGVVVSPGSVKTPAGVASAGMPAGVAGTGNAGGKEAPVHMEAVLMLPNQKPIELIVNEVMYKKGARQ